jgi:ferredoxin
MDVKVNRTDCISCGICWTECPELFEQNEDDDLCQIILTHRSGDNLGKGTVPAELKTCAREVADQCPVSVIELND